MNRIQIFNLKNKFIKLNKYICIQIFNLKNTNVSFGIQNATDIYIGIYKCTSFIYSNTDAPSPNCPVLLCP